MKNKLLLGIETVTRPLPRYFLVQSEVTAISPLYRLHEIGTVTTVTTVTHICTSGKVHGLEVR